MTSQPSAPRPADTHKILIVDDDAMQGDREKCLAVGMDDYVSKPMRLTELQAVLERWRPIIQPSTAPAEPALPA